MAQRRPDRQLTVPRFRVVLVRPETASNVGACARAARNTGAAGLDLVQPGDWRTLECWRSAWGAHDVLEQARVFPEIGPALADAALAVAFTARRPAAGPPVEDVRVAAEAVAALGRHECAALVFGPETSGLTNDELGRCGRAASIPSDPAQPSYNLSHAVAIAGYEVHRAIHPSVDAPRKRATHEQKQQLLTLLVEGLAAIGALPPATRARTLAAWRSLVNRSDLTERELRLLEHASRKMAAAGRSR